MTDFRQARDANMVLTLEGLRNWGVGQSWRRNKSSSISETPNVIPLEYGKLISLILLDEGPEIYQKFINQIPLSTILQSDKILQEHFIQLMHLERKTDKNELCHPDQQYKSLHSLQE